MAMADYVNTVSPDYSSTTLSVTPQSVVNEIGDKNIEVHQADDGSEVRVILSDTVIFYVTLQWDRLCVTDSETLMDFWADADKANGKAYSFKWEHPTDGYTYVVRFDSDVSREIKAGSIYGITQIRLRILGVAA